MVLYVHHGVFSMEIASQRIAAKIQKQCIKTEMSNAEGTTFMEETDMIPSSKNREKTE